MIGLMLFAFVIWCIATVGCFYVRDGQGRIVMPSARCQIAYVALASALLFVAFLNTLIASRMVP